MKKAVVVVLLGLSLSACGGSKPPLDAPQETRHFPLDSLSDVLASSGVSYDPDVSTDSRGSIRVDANGKMTVPLFELNDVSCENCILAYQARLKTENLDGQAYLEMWVRVPNRGEFFSRSVDHPLTGSTDWTLVSTPLFLQAGQAPDLVRLNLVVDGRGKVWIDDVRVQHQPMPPPPAIPGS